MAKFRVKPDLVAALTAAGYFPAGLMTLRIPHKANRITGETCYEVQIGTDTIFEVSNDFAMETLRGYAPPAIKNNGAWLIADPATTPSIFEEVADLNAVATLTAHTDGTQVLTKTERGEVAAYRKRTGVVLPNSVNHATMLPYLNAARGQQ